MLNGYLNQSVSTLLLQLRTAPAVSS
jgi:hypothetical protein